MVDLLCWWANNYLIISIELMIIGLFMISVAIFVCWYNKSFDFAEEESEEHEVANSDIPPTFFHLDELKGNPCCNQL